MDQFLRQSSKVALVLIAILLPFNIFLFARRWFAPAETSTSSVPITAPLHGTRELIWPVCRTGYGLPPSEDPAVYGCEWFNTDVPRTRFPAATVQDEKRFWTRVEAPSLLDSRPPTQHIPLSPEQRERFEDARAYVFASRVSPELWRWENVLSVIDAVGEDPYIVSVVSELDERHPLGSYNAYEHLMSFSEDTLAGPTDRLAAVLIHEATHAVYHRLLAETAWLHADDLAWIVWRCGDIRTVIQPINEGLAYLNEHIWMLENAHLTEVDARIGEHALASRRGELLGATQYAVYADATSMWSYDLPRLFQENSGVWSEADIVSLRRTYDLACGPLIRMEPDGTADYISPVDVDPEYLTELYELGRLDIEELHAVHQLELDFRFAEALAVTADLSP